MLQPQGGLVHRGAAHAELVGDRLLHSLMPRGQQPLQDAGLERRIGGLRQAFAGRGGGRGGADPRRFRLFHAHSHTTNHATY